MTTTRLPIKNMVCDRCIQAVREELEKIHLGVAEVTLGEVVITDSGKVLDKELIREVLEKRGFKLIEDKRERMVERMKTLIIQLIHYDDPPALGINYSGYLAGQIGRDYAYISQVFSAHEGTTLEKYIILQKVERAKELIAYDELAIGQIARQLGYRSLAHFSNQFKRITRFTPSQYKRSDQHPRQGLDKLSPLDALPTSP